MFPVSSQRGSTVHWQDQSALTLLMHRPVCRCHSWLDSLHGCLQTLGVEIFAKLVGPYPFQCGGSLRHGDRMDDLGAVRRPVLLVHGARPPAQRQFIRNTADQP